MKKSHLSAGGASGDTKGEGSSVNQRGSREKKGKTLEPSDDLNSREMMSWRTKRKKKHY